MTDSMISGEGDRCPTATVTVRGPSLARGKMNALTAMLLFTLVTPAFAAEERSTPTLVPQPRVRLDPVSRTAAIASPTDARKVSSMPVVAMDRFIVREKVLVEKEPAGEEGPKGSFSLLGGGTLATRDVGRTRWEIGAWPWLPKTDVMWKEQKFKPQKTRVDLDFVRMRW